MGKQQGFLRAFGRENGTKPNERQNAAVWS
jgi:hypothetical protein